jgi:hypothetical protein
MRSGLAGVCGLLAASAASSETWEQRQARASDYVRQITAGCTALATIQMRDCRVTHVYDCGPKGRVDVALNASGWIGANSMSADFDQKSWVGLDGFGRSVTVGTEKTFSLSELRRNGRSEGRYQVDLEVDYFKGRVPQTYEAVLDGTTQVIRGKTYYKGQGVARTFMPQPYGTFEVFYDLALSADAPLMALSEKEHRFPQGREVFPSGVMDVISPGEPGFLDNRAQHDCAG